MTPVSISAFAAAPERTFWKQRTTWLGVAVYLLFCIWVFRDFLLSGGTHIASLSGDAVKNLFTYLYSAAYDGGSLRFGGMNYPFGEHLSFADAQPLLTLPVAWLQQGLHLSQPHLVLLMYWAIALSMVVGMLYTQRLLQWFGLPALWAVVLAALIGIMSPHTFRYTGHFPLAYASLLPMLFYWSVRYHETNRNPYLVKLFFLFLAYAFLHLYFLALGLLWSVAYSMGILLLRSPKGRNKFGHGFRFLLPVMSVLTITKIFFALTDGITDRPGLPYIGGYEPGGGLTLVFNDRSPIWRSARDLGLLSLYDSGGEFAYLGFVPVGMLLLFGVFYFSGFWKKLSAGQRPFDIQWIFMAGGILLFAVTVKYYWERGAFSKLLSPLRQFRAPERFVWIGYYVFSVLAAVLLCRLCRYGWAKGWKRASPALGILLTLVWAIDASGAISFFQGANENSKSNGVYFFSRENSWKAHLAKSGYAPEAFSALLALPYVHVGSEKLGVDERINGLMPAFKASVEMQLPLMDVYMSRTSWAQTFESVRLAGGIYANKSVLEKLPAPHKPILVFTVLDAPPSPDEEALLQPEVADPLGEIDGCRLYAFWPQKLLRQQMIAVQQAKVLAAAAVGTDTVLNSSLPVYVNHYESGGGEHAFAGRSGIPAIKGEDSALAEVTFSKPLAVAEPYEFSAWSQFPPRIFRWNFYQLQCFDTAGKELQLIPVIGRYSVDNAPDLWFRVSTFFELPAGTVRMAIKVVNHGGASYLAMDEILLRPAKALVISRLPDGKIMANNHLLPH
jgi:hypothetical protein